MPEDTNLELLSVIHDLQTASQKAQEMLTNAIEVSRPSGFFPMTLETATMVQSLLAVQSKLIGTLVEQNQETLDHLESFVSRITNR